MVAGQFLHNIFTLKNVKDRILLFILNNINIGNLRIEYHRLSRTRNSLKCRLLTRVSDEMLEVMSNHFT